MKKFLLLFVCLIVFTLGAREASAHVLLTDGSIGAVLHIDPDDNPIAKQQTNFFLEFKDKDNKFKPSDCECTFSILESGKEIYSTPLFTNNTDPNLMSASASFTFPQKDIYTIKITGKPISPNEFQSFTLTQDERVDREASGESSSTKSNWIVSHIVYIIGALVVLVVIIFMLVSKKRKPTKKTEKEVKE